MGRGIAVRIALAALASAAVGVAILAIGVTVVGADVFTALMVEAGDSADHARAMYDQSVTVVVIAAVGVAATASIVLAIMLARMLARPLAEIGTAARRVAEGDYGARVPREGPEELVSLADSFNQMAASLERQEAMRRDFIANAAHELRTPLTNLQGYLEALRDGVITPDRATYESLWDEAERLVRLSRSLDSLAEGDAAGPPPLVELDLAMAVRNALELAQPSLERAGLTVVVDVPEHLPARANADQLAQVLANLLSNAVALHAGRRHGDGPCRAPCHRPPGLDREQRRGDPAGGPRPRLRALLPRGEVARSRSAAAPASGWRSSSSWSNRRAGSSAPSRAQARRASGSASRPDAARRGRPRRAPRGGGRLRVRTRSSAPSSGPPRGSGSGLSTSSVLISNERSGRNVPHQVS